MHDDMRPFQMVMTGVRSHRSRIQLTKPFQNIVPRKIGTWLCQTAGGSDAAFILLICPSVPQDNNKILAPPDYTCAEFSRTR